MTSYSDDSTWTEAPLKFQRMHIAQSLYNDAFARGDFRTAWNQLNVIHQEVAAYCKDGKSEVSNNEFEEGERHYKNTKMLVYSRNANAIVVQDALRAYNVFLFKIRKARHMDLPRGRDPSKAMLE